MTATPPQGIDRDALLRYLRTEGLKDSIEQVADRILALVRPVEGVTLTREEREKLAYLVEHASYSSTLDIFVIEWFEEHGAALVARLEAAQ